MKNSIRLTYPNRNLLLWLLWIVSFMLSVSQAAQAQAYPAGSPVAINGKLKISGTKLVNQCDNPVQLRGMSSHGVQWFQSCYTTSSLNALVNDWGIDVFRIAMYVQEGGYVNNPNYWKGWIDNMVDECGARGIYCLIDWHVLTPGNPNANLTEARDFWSYMSQKHAGKAHVLYEIANEPNGVNWSTIKTYANDIIPRIRANDPNTVIIVGTPTWSQDVDIAANDPLTFSNLMYALHFYSGTHGQYLRDKADLAISKGLSLFVTEFGTSSATGDGGPYLNPQMDQWMEWMNSRGISWANWSFADKAESSAALAPGACSGSSWNNTSTSGTYIKSKINTPDSFVCEETTPTTYTITASAGTNGTLTPSGNISVNAGSNQTFTFTPATGYQLSQVTVNGSPVAITGSTYMFTNVQANQTIAVTFQAITATTYTIAASAEANGSISPVGNVDVAAGTDKSFTITPNMGYAIDKVMVNGISAGAVGTYTFTNVQANQSIAATFKASTITPGDIIGPDCATANTTVTFEVDPSRQANAISYSWWYNASSQSTTPVVGMPYKVNLATGSYFGTGQICVGINYSVAPWYVSYCKTVSVCAAGVRSGKAPETYLLGTDTQTLAIVPNPSGSEFSITTNTPVQSYTIYNETGQVVCKGTSLKAGMQTQFGTDLKPGLYIFRVQFANGKTDSKKIIKQ